MKIPNKVIYGVEVDSEGENTAWEEISKSKVEENIDYIQTLIKAGEADIPQMKLERKDTGVVAILGLRDHEDEVGYRTALIELCSAIPTLAPDNLSFYFETTHGYGIMHVEREFVTGCFLDSDGEVINRISETEDDSGGIDPSMIDQHTLSCLISSFGVRPDALYVNEMLTTLSNRGHKIIYLGDIDSIRNEWIYW